MFKREGKQLDCHLNSSKLKKYKVTPAIVFDRRKRYYEVFSITSIPVASPDLFQMPSVLILNFAQVTTKHDDLAVTMSAVF